MANKKVLFILPHDNFRDKEYEWVVERLDEAGVEHQVVSSHKTIAKGQHGLEVEPDMTPQQIDPSSFDGFIFVGEETSAEFIANRDIEMMLDTAFSYHKLVAAIGYAVDILIRTRHVNGKKITGHSTRSAEIEASGAYYSGKTVEKDHNLITGAGPFSTREFAETIVEDLVPSGSRSGRQYLR